MLVVIYAKILHATSFPQFTKPVNQFYYLSRANENLET